MITAGITAMIEPKGGGSRLFDHLMPRVSDVADFGPGTDGFWTFEGLVQLRHLSHL